MILPRLSLTVKMLALTALVGSGIWAASDLVQTTFLRETFNAKLAERLRIQAEEQRIMFDRYVKGHHQAVKLFTTTQNLRAYLRNNEWQPDAAPVIHMRTPDWLPGASVLRNFIQPRYLLLLDGAGKVRELYQAQPDVPPDSLLAPGEMLLNLSRNQGFLTTLDGIPYLIASEEVLDAAGRREAILMLASPLDELFLVASQSSTLAGGDVIALVNEYEPTILVSSDSALIPPGARLDSLEQRYMITGWGFFDYGATDILIKLVSFISTAEVRQLTREVLTEDRQLRGITAFVFVVAFLLVILLITRRVQRLTRRVVDFSRNMNLEQPPLDKGDQLWILEERFERLAEAIEAETAALEHQALHDPLTDLPNRKLLHSRLQHEILRGERNRKPLALILTDLDRFKEINDTLGHHIGDLVLQQAGERLFHIFRKTDTVARLGGDEFGILLPETSAEWAIRLAHKVIEAFNEPFAVEGHSLAVGISIGIAEYPSHGDDVNILVQRADVAMYMAKRNGLGYAVYDPSKDQHSIGRLALMSEFRKTIDEDGLDVFYQPIANMRSGEIIGAEALLRWQHPERGFIPPDDFIPLAEQTGLLQPITHMVLERALRQSLAWKERDLALAVSVNLSVNSLLDASLQGEIDSHIRELSACPSCLILEITESDIMVDPIRVRETLRQLSEAGIRVSIDDFGTGYSSLSYLKQLPVDKIKIDRSFVMEMAQDENDAVIVRATIELAHNLGLKVVAEGVQDEQTWNLLVGLGCDFAQGHFISPAVPATTLTEWLETRSWMAPGTLRIVT